MDKSLGDAEAKDVGLSVRNGPVGDAMDIDGPSTNGKRKSRNSIPTINYAANDDDSDDAPMVGPTGTGFCTWWC